MTGQALVELAVARLANGSDSELVRVLKLWELSDSQHLPKQVERWRTGRTQTVPWDVAWRILERLGAINWDALKGNPIGLSLNDRSRTP